MTDISDEAIRAYAANIFDLEDAREVTQSDLKDAWAHIREAHGKKFADSLKLAVKRARQDADKRAAADEVDAEAERIMAILSAPRATRTIARIVPEQSNLRKAQIAIESTAARKDVQGKGPTSSPPAVATKASERTEPDGVAGVTLGRKPSSEAQFLDPAGTQAPPVDTITDLTQPNPICRDPGDCGVYASWHHPCLACKRSAAVRAAA